MNIKMVILDLDGTVLRDDKTISQKTISVLKQCQKEGILIAVATARSPQAAKKYLNQICPDLIIANGGALVQTKEAVLYQCTMPAPVTDRIIHDLMNRPDFISLSVETPSSYYTTWETADSDDYAYGTVYDFCHPLGQEAYKITVELQDISKISPEEFQYPDCTATPFCDGNWYRFAHRDAGKINGVCQAAKAMHLSLEQVAAFGDDAIDQEMIQQCGMGIAMGNAIPSVQAVADAVCDTNQNDGVACWLEEHLLAHNNKTTE
ncbi:MAG: HAD family hydrolase [Massiliimalia sp.]|jgi:Cof subfamily protein (haloacid dehalogenase superfamily)